MSRCNRLEWKQVKKEQRCKIKMCQTTHAEWKHKHKCKIKTSQKHKQKPETMVNKQMQKENATNKQRCNTDTGQTTSMQRKNMPRCNVKAYSKVKKCKRKTTDRRKMKTWRILAQRKHVKKTPTQQTRYIDATWKRVKQDIGATTSIW